MEGKIMKRHKRDTSVHPRSDQWISNQELTLPNLIEERQEKNQYNDAKNILEHCRYD